MAACVQAINNFLQHDAARRGGRETELSRSLARSLAEGSLSFRLKPAFFSYLVFHALAKVTFFSDRPIDRVSVQLERPATRYRSDIDRQDSTRPITDRTDESAPNSQL